MKQTGRENGKCERQGEKKGKRMSGCEGNVNRINERRRGTTQLTDKNKWLLRPRLSSALIVSDCQQMKANTS